MKKILIVFSAFFLCACWSTNETVNKSNSNTKLNSAKIPANVEVVKVSNSNSKMVPYKDNVSLEEARRQQQNVKVIDKKTKAPKEGIPAPDNSTFKTRFDAEGFTATRTFNDHPKLIKIEKKQIGKETTLKAYLKNGKVYDVSEEKVPNFRVNSPSHILAAIGLGPKQEKQKGINKDKLEQLKPKKQ